MLRLIKGDAGGFVLKHKEIVGDNEVKLVVGPFTVRSICLTWELGLSAALEARWAR